MLAAIRGAMTIVLVWVVASIGQAAQRPAPDVLPTPEDPSVGRGLLVSADSEPLELPGILDPDVATVTVRELAGAPVTLRVTPVNEDGKPVDGGRVITLRANERRSVLLTATLPFEDLRAHRLVVETLAGAGQAEVNANWLTWSEATAAAASHAVRHRLTRVSRPPSDALIDQAEASGALDHETAVLYHVYAIFGDARLPQAYRGDDAGVFESLYLSTVVSEWSGYSAATQAALKPFLMPPIYRGSWANPATTNDVHALGNVGTLDLPPICDGTEISGVWLYKENANGKVRIWYDTAANDAAVAAFLATAADTKIWPGYVAFMGSHEPLPDAAESCDGGNGRLDVYLTDIPRSFTQGHSACSHSPAFIVLERTADVSTLAHEIFHAFQYSFEVGGCLSSNAYRWWTEGSATWAEQYLYPFDWLALQQGSRLVNTPEQALDSVRTDIDRVYGTFLVPFYVQNATGSPDFVRTAWENCKNQDAIHAVDAVIPGGFARTWHEIALRDWNRKPADEYTQWRPQLTYQANPQIALQLTSGPDRETTLPVNLAHLSATYKHFEFSGTEISSVAFFNGATFNLQKQDTPPYGPYWTPQTAPADQIQGVKVQAVITIEGQPPRVEDWTNKKYVTFCRDVIDERLQDLTIIISNARLDDTAGNAAPPGLRPVLWVSNMGCYKWTGSAHYELTGQVTASQVDDVSDLVWTRVSADHAPPEVLYQASGHINVTMGNHCSGSGTLTITPAASSLVTYNFTPADAAGRRAYSGASFESSTFVATCDGRPTPVMGGPWFNIVPPAPPNPPQVFVTSDGKHMNGIYTNQGLLWQWHLTAQRQ